MKPSSAILKLSTTRTRRNVHGGSRTILLVFVVFLIGVGIGVFVFYRASGPHAGNVPGDAGSSGATLSEGTKSVLKNLKSPVEIRFYSLLKDAGVNESLSPFAGRVGQLLSEFEDSADGKIRIIRHDSPSEDEMSAASADGITPFNLEKGDPCYLGIVVSQGAQKDSIPLLAEEWEPALEFDLTRAILRVTKPAATRPAAADSVKIDSTTTEEVKQLIPGFDSVSVEEGTAILREAARKEFTEAATELQKKVKAAQDHFTEVTQSGKSESEQQAALKQFQTVQAEQTETLNQIAARYRERVAALEQLKSNSR